MPVQAHSGRRAILFSALVMLCACSSTGAPHGSASATRETRVAGPWEGVVNLKGSAPILITISLDHTGDAWRGSLQSPAFGSQPVAFATVAVTGDSLTLSLPAEVQKGVFRGRIDAAGARFDGVMETPGGIGQFATARPGTAGAAAITAEARRIAESRRVAGLLSDSAKRTAPAAPQADPAAARLVTSDIPLFWHAVDMAGTGDLAALLQREYLERASIGVRDFIPGRILSAEDLAMAVRTRRARYDSARATMFAITSAEPAIRAAFVRLKALYPDAVFPDVYFVVGRFNSGGTSTQHGLLIGAEMQSDPNRVPAIVSHELIHFQQHGDTPTLLSHAFMEGAADFIGEMISGSQINNAAHRYGLAHEHELWQEFRQHFDDRELFPWMYGAPPDGRPNDLGYFIGYRIAQAYYARTPDKAKAIRDIISAREDNVRSLLAASGYNP